MRRAMCLAGLAAVVLAAGPACATKKYVQTEVAQVNEKVSGLSDSLEATQERVREHEQRIGEVDQRAQAAAQEARREAEGARRLAGEVEARASARADAIEAAQRKLLFEVVLSADQGQFPFGAAELPPDAQAALDRLVEELKAQSQSVWIEIEGHTDNVGDARYNEELGLRRAEAVKRYLYEKHQVPLHKMNVISYGETKPTAPNSTREGRAQNRRVVVRVLA